MKKIIKRLVFQILIISLGANSLQAMHRLIPIFKVFNTALNISNKARPSFPNPITAHVKTNIRNLRSIGSRTYSAPKPSFSIPKTNNHRFRLHAGIVGTACIGTAGYWYYQHQQWQNNKHSHLFDEFQKTNARFDREDAHKLYEIKKEIFTDETLQTVWRQAFALETQLESQGYTVFYHGKAASYNFHERLFTHLWCLKNKVTPNENFIFPHAKPIKKITQQQRFFQWVNEKLFLRESNLGNGDKVKLDDKFFMNYGLFSNPTIPGSSTPRIIIENQIGGRIPSLKKTCNNSGMPEIYDLFKKDLEQLESKHHELSKHGALYVVAIPRNKLRKHIYEDWWKSDNKPISLERINNQQSYPLDHTWMSLNKPATPHKLPKQLNNQQSYYPRYYFVLDVSTVNPDSGIIVKDLLPANPHKLHDYKKQEAELFEKINLYAKEKKLI